MEGFDYAVFKVLASNDTGGAPGHQGGIVIPKDIADFFPPLPLEASPENPTVEVMLAADLFRESHYLETTQTRYQHQTWGGNRSPERRLTANLGAIRNSAHAGDILVFEKNLVDPLRIRIRLLRAGCAEHSEILRSNAGGKNWGIADPAQVPISVHDYSAASERLDQSLALPFNGFAEDRPTIEMRSTRLARSAMFRQQVLAAYGSICAISRDVLETPMGQINLDAAHIIGVRMGGSDDPRNGLALSKDLHWAFDTGLISVDENRLVMVSDATKFGRNRQLGKFVGIPIHEAHSFRHSAAEEAFAWHRKTVFNRTV